ncbi:MAG: glutamate--tRNA ligase [Phycisphaerales bacterium]|nr:MAG: glutamate--tRNA ligase [Phycisphaerales bacterium]
MVSTDSSTAPITRFAPSPTGHLHVGGARTALFCWAFARRYGGRFILRIEDTDLARSSVESARGIMEDLAWLGIDWNEGPVLEAGDGRTKPVGGDPRGIGPFFQAQRLHLYNTHLERLIEQDMAYAAFDTTEELDSMRREVTAKKQTFRYDRSRAMAIPKGERERRRRAGEACVIRLAAPAGEIVVVDEVLGEVKYAAGELDDFVIRKADGMPTYHFAVVVDDETMGVTHVMRAQEHLNNTPRHVALQRALGFRTPVYAHMPIISNMDGSKMSKRDKAKVARVALKAEVKKDTSPGGLATLAARIGVEAGELQAFMDAENDSVATASRIAGTLGVVLPEIEVDDFRRSGYLPEAIVNFLSLLGWNPGMKTEDGKDLEKFDAAFLASHFSVERIGKTSSKFDRVKLMAFNASAIQSLPAEEFASRWRAWAKEYEPEFAAAIVEDRWSILARGLQPRAKTFADAVKNAWWAVIKDDAYPFDDAAVKKNLLANDKQGLGVLKDLRERLHDIGTFTPESIHAVIEGYASEKDLGMGQVAQPLRVAVTGAGVSPGLGETLGVLGRDHTLARIDRCLLTFQ